jgi:transcription initiation factor IIE alpha subunit
MTEPTDSPEEMRIELQDIEETLQRLRSEQATRGDDVGDQSDDASALTSYEEDQALIENLESRRERLTQRLKNG